MFVDFFYLELHPWLTSVYALGGKYLIAEVVISNATCVLQTVQ